MAWAGAGLVRALLGANLVDELRLVVFPAILGSGTRLIAEVCTELGLPYRTQGYRYW